MQIVTATKTANVDAYFCKDRLSGRVSAWANASEMPEGFLTGFTATENGTTRQFKRTFNEKGLFVFKAIEDAKVEFVVRRKR